MPGRVQADPEELRRFAGTLEGFNKDLIANLARLQSQFQHLGDTWKDDAYERFDREFQKTARFLGRFLVDAGDYVAELRRSASVLDDVHRR